MNRKVGYGSPPEHARFRQGQSGNPSGRPKKPRTLAEDVAAEFAEAMHITEGGRKRRITKQRALVKSVTAAGIKGNTRAASLLLNLVRLIQGNPQVETDEALSAADLKILEDHLEREVQRRQAQGRSSVAPPVATSTSTQPASQADRPTDVAMRDPE